MAGCNGNEIRPRRRLSAHIRWMTRWIAGWLAGWLGDRGGQPGKTLKSSLVSAVDGRSSFLRSALTCMQLHLLHERSSSRLRFRFRLVAAAYYIIIGCCNIRIIASVESESEWCAKVDF